MFTPKYHIDLMYMNQVSYKLDLFNKVNDRTYNCRCPFCGDSKKSKKKTRFYFYTKKGNLNTHCKNCDHSSSFYNFLKEIDEELFQEYKKDTLLDSFVSNKSKPSQPVDQVQSTQIITKKVCSCIPNCVKLSELDEKHEAVKYVVSRKFTQEIIDKLYYTEDFKKVAEHINKESSENLRDNDKRIIIPFYTEDNKIKCVQGRTLDKFVQPKYITIKADDEHDKIYGINDIDRSKPIICVEGPFDSMFVDNCVATCDANLLSCDFADIYVFDNQPRNKDIVKLMEIAIQRNKKIFIWPISSDKKLDINDLVIRGMKKQTITKMILSHSFSGLKAKLELTKWKRV